MANTKILTLNEYKHDLMNNWRSEKHLVNDGTNTYLVEVCLGILKITDIQTGKVLYRGEHNSVNSVMQVLEDVQGTVSRIEDMKQQQREQAEAKREQELANNKQLQKFYNRLEKKM